MNEELMAMVDEELDEQFHVDTPEKAEWALQKIALEREEVRRFKMVVDNMIMEYQRKLAAFTEAHNTRYLESMLQAFFEIVPHKQTKTMEQYITPSGKLIRKFGGNEYLSDESALVPWLESNMPELVNVEKSAKWADLKAKVKLSGNGVVDENGETVPGVTVNVKPDTFIVEV